MGNSFLTAHEPLKHYSLSSYFYIAKKPFRVWFSYRHGTVGYHFPNRWNSLSFPDQGFLETDRQTNSSISMQHRIANYILSKWQVDQNNKTSKVGKKVPRLSESVFEQFFRNTEIQWLSLIFKFNPWPFSNSVNFPWLQFFLQNGNPEYRKHSRNCQRCPVKVTSRVTEWL